MQVCEGQIRCKVMKNKAVFNCNYEYKNKNWIKRKNDQNNF